MNNSTLTPQDQSETITVEKTVDGYWQIVVRVGFFSTLDDASDAAGHLLRGTMWEHNDGIFNPITRPPYTIH